LANVIVGVTGGIAAYKSASLIRLFTEAGHSVQVVATSNATRFIGKITLEALSHNRVEIIDPDLFTDVEGVKHVALAKAADLVVVAPATASFIAKVASGIADDLLTTTVLTATCPIIVAPAMHTEMWDNVATVSNVSTLKSRGFNIVEPGTGRLTGEDSGVGRLAEPETIFEAGSAFLGERTLAGFRVLVTTGGTRERIDPARFIGNYSSGKQGIAFAQAAKEMGAVVHVIAANVSDSLLAGLEHENVDSAAELKLALEAQLGKFDILIMAAAVADYRPAITSTSKIKRSETGENLELDLVANPDLLQAFVKELGNRQDKALVIGFAAETSDNLVPLARTKLSSKGCDFIVVNDISSGDVFNSSNNSVTLVSSGSEASFSGTKYEVARGVLSHVSSKVVRTPRGDKI
jgi:phosphopantothenoylcysteine decarboxylase/phosphopantothenate--cysteine ligase